MWQTKCTSLSGMLFRWQIRTRTLSIRSVNEKRYFLVSVNNYSVDANLGNDSRAQKLIRGPILSTSGILTSKSGVRHSSTYNTAADSVSPVLNYLPTQLFQDLALWIHSTTHLPWWASIVLYTIVLRIVVYSPISIYQKYLSFRYANVQTELKGHEWRLKGVTEKLARQNGWSKRTEYLQFLKFLREERLKMYVRDNCHPAKISVNTMIVLLLFMSQTWAIRELCYMMPVPGVSENTSSELAKGGIAWFKNLTQPDQYFILPLFTTFLTYGNIKTNHLLYPHLPKQTERIWKIIRKSMLIIFPSMTLVITSQMPAGVVVSWITTNVFTLIETILFAKPEFRRLIGLPKIDNEINQPLTIIKNGVKRKLGPLPKLKSS